MVCAVLNIYGTLIERCQYAHKPISNLARGAAVSSHGPPFRRAFLNFHPRCPSCDESVEGEHGEPRMFPDVYAAARVKLLTDGPDKNQPLRCKTPD